MPDFSAPTFCTMSTSSAPSLITCSRFVNFHLRQRRAQRKSNHRANFHARPAQNLRRLRHVPRIHAHRSQIQISPLLRTAREFPRAKHPASAKCDQSAKQSIRRPQTRTLLSRNRRRRAISAKVRLHLLRNGPHHQIVFATRQYSSLFRFVSPAVLPRSLRLCGKRRRCCSRRCGCRSSQI